MGLTSRNIVVTLSAVTQGFQTQMNAAARNVQTFNQQIGTIGGAFNNYNTAVNKAAVSTNQLSSATLPAVQATTNLGTAGVATTSRMDKLREVFAGNRGLIYSMGAIFGTITGVIFELQLMGDASQQVAQDTAKLNQLQAAGLEGTKEYQQAEAALAKDQRFLSFSTRNLAAAVANFVPELLMVTSMLSKGGGVTQIFSGALSKLTPIFGGLTGATAGAATATGAFSGALANMNNVTSAGIGNLGGLKAAFVGLLGPIGLAVAAAAAIALGVKALQDRMDAAGLKFTQMKNGLLMDQESGNKSANEFSEVAGKTGKSALQMAIDPAGTKADFEQKGGKFGPDGNVMASNQTALQKQVDGWAAYTRQLIAAQVPLDNVVKAMKDTGLTMTEINPMISEQQIAVGRNKDAFAGWEAAINPANIIINKLKDSVMSGVLPANMLGEAIQNEIATMTEYGQISETTAGAVDILASNHLNSLIPGVANTSKAVKAAAKDESEYMKAIDAANKTLADRARESEEVLAVENNLNAAFGTHQSILQADWDVQKKMNDVINEAASAYKTEEMSIFQVLATHKLLSPQVRALMENQQDDTKVMYDMIEANVDWSKAMHDSTLEAKLQSQGRAEAVLSAEEFVNSTIRGTAAQKEYDAIMRDVIRGQTTWGDALNLTGEQAKMMAQEIIATGQSAESVATIVREKTAPALELLQGVIGAKSWKEFKDAFKDLDIGDAPKKFQSWAKEFSNDLRKVAQHGSAAGDTFKIMTKAIADGQMPVDIYGKGIGFMQKELKKIDKNATQPIVDFLEKMKSADPQAMLQYSDAFNQFFTNIAAGNNPTLEAQALIQKLGLNTQEAGKNAENATPQLDAAQQAIVKLGKEASATVTITAVMSASMVESVGAAGSFIVGAFEEMKKKGISNIGQMATTIVSVTAKSAASMVSSYGQAFAFVISAMGKLADESKTMLKKLDVSFAACNSLAKQFGNQMRQGIDKATGAMQQAESQAKALEKAIGNLKSKDITVTTTFKYKTVGSPPKNASGFKIDSADNLSNSDSMYLPTGGKQNSDSIGGGSGTQVIHLHISGNELIPERTITRLIKRVSGNSIPSMQ